MFKTHQATENEKYADTAEFDNQPQLKGAEERYDYYITLLNALAGKCLAYNGDGVLQPMERKVAHATLDIYIGEEHWFLYCMYNDGDVFGVQLYNRKRDDLIITHRNPNAIIVLQELLAARWRTAPEFEDE